jgi:dihydrofolate reductase
MNILNTKTGFIDAYFYVEHQLKNSLEAFNYLNKQVEVIYGKKTFKSFKEFKNELVLIEKTDLESSEGFCNAYFNILPKFNTNIEAFNYLNKQVEVIYGKKLYNSYKEFITDV